MAQEEWHRYDTQWMLFRWNKQQGQNYGQRDPMVMMMLQVENPVNSHHLHSELEVSQKLGAKMCDANNFTVWGQFQFLLQTLVGCLLGSIGGKGNDATNLQSLSRKGKDGCQRDESRNQWAVGIRLTSCQNWALVDFSDSDRQTAGGIDFWHVNYPMRRKTVKQVVRSGNKFWYQTLPIDILLFKYSVAIL